MDLDQEFIELYEGWKKGKYKVTDGKRGGKILGTFSSGGKAQKFVDDLFQKGDYEKLTVELIDEAKHECPKCKGKGCDHCDGKGYHVEDEDDDPVGKNEASAYRDRSQKDAKKKGYKDKYGKMPFVFTNKKRNAAGVREDVELDENKIVVGGKELDREWTGWWWDKKDKWTVVDGKNNMLWTAKSSGEVEKRAEELRGFAKVGNSSKFSLSVTNPGYVTNHGRWGMPELDGDKMWKSIKSKPDQITIRKIDKKDYDRWFKREKLINKEYDYNDLELSFSGGRKHYAPVEKEEVEIDEMPNRAYKEKINTLLKKYSGKFKWSGEELYVTKEIEKDVRDIISKDKGHSYMVKVSKNPLREAVNLKQLKKQYNKNEDENRHTENYLLLAKAFGSKSEVKKVQDIMKRNEKQGHTSKSDMDWMYKNINPYYDKIRNEEYMKLEDTVKQVLVGKKEEPTVEEQKVKKEDTDKDEPGTQGDMKKYQAARAKVMKKFGVKSCSELEGDEKKACYAALDAAHVSDDEEEKGEKKEEVKTTFSKMFTHVKSLMQGK